MTWTLSCIGGINSKSSSFVKKIADVYFASRLSRNIVDKITLLRDKRKITEIITKLLRGYDKLCSQCLFQVGRTSLEQGAKRLVTRSVGLSDLLRGCSNNTETSLGFHVTS